MARLSEHMVKAFTLDDERLEKIRGATVVTFRVPVALPDGSD